MHYILVISLRSPKARAWVSPNTPFSEGLLTYRMLLKKITQQFTETVSFTKEQIAIKNF